MKKKIGCLILAFFMMLTVSGSFLNVPENVQAAEPTEKYINVVYDDSGSRQNMPWRYLVPCFPKMIPLIFSL